MTGSGQTWKHSEAAFPFTIPAREYSDGSCLSSQLEQFNRIAVWICYLNVFPSWPDFHLIPKLEASPFEFFDSRWEIGNFKDYLVPDSGLLASSIGHRTGS